MLEKNIAQIKALLAEAAAKSGRSPEEITLVAVTKTVSPEMIRAAWEWGINDFGENRVQEALPKIRELPAGIRWHFIGHLQSNKVRAVLPSFALLHSLDSMKLAGVIQAEAKKNNQKTDVLLQINIGAEESKFGFKEEEVKAVLEELAGYPNLRVRGLMAIAPFLPDPEAVRPYFRRLYRLFKRINVPGVEMKYLSAGMTNDFTVAVEEGANMIRLGSALFGERR